MRPGAIICTGTSSSRSNGTGGEFAAGIHRWVTPSLGTERACKACAYVPAWFDSRVTHHHQRGRSWKVEHLSATQENRFRLPTSAPSSPVSKSGDCTRLKSAGGQFESGAGHHFGAGSGLQLILARSTSGVRLSVAPPSLIPVEPSWRGRSAVNGGRHVRIVRREPMHQ